MQSTNFSGQPIFCQLLSLIPRRLISDLVLKYQSDRYYKRFKTHTHLVTMLFAGFQGCQSLREVTTGLQAWYQRLRHLGISSPPRRSTLSEANQKRPAALFEDLFHALYHFHYSSSPDSRKSKKLLERLFIIDSTTISLFQDILKDQGSLPHKGHSKGGAKAHVLINAKEDVPRLVVVTPPRTSDHSFLEHIQLPKGSILVFDRAYTDYFKWAQLGREGVYWVTREKKGTYFKPIDVRTLSKNEEKAGVILDQIGWLGRERPGYKPIKVRKILFQSPLDGRMFVFITNHLRFKPSTIAQFYKQRWQIELLFKRLKQNYPLRYFLGENENAVRIQIWCSLICDLLTKIVKEKFTARKWAFSNLASLIRIHLGTYIDLRGFLDNPEKALLKPNSYRSQYVLFET